MRACALALGLALAGCTSEAWDPMEEQPRPQAYAPSDVFSDRRAMRPVPEGTVAREAPRGAIVNLHDLPDAGGFVMPPQPPLTAHQLDRGQHIFEITCAACHGLRGDGQSAVAMKMSLRAPANLLDPPASALTDAQLFAVITEGYGMMPSLQSWIAADDRWAVVAYLRALQLSAGVPRERLTARDLAHLDQRVGRKP